MSVECFWIESTGTAKVGLRRYRSSTREPLDCPREGGRWKYHGAVVYLGEAPCPLVEHEDGPRFNLPVFDYPGHDDPRWPARCECGYAFEAVDEWQDWYEPLYRRVDTGETMTMRDAAPGAMFDAFWYWRKGPDGRSLGVKCPNGDTWLIDSRASNCTMKDDDVHRCWIRHGEPPKITVNKEGPTCAAGGGSIQAGDYHGFLIAGAFT